ncbi:SMI1/KNR4 family protein [Burkholderia sp. NLJ2]
MDLEIRNILPKPTADAIAEVEAVLGAKLPQEYLNLIRKMSGAYFEGGFF